MRTIWTADCTARTGTGLSVAGCRSGWSASGSGTAVSGWRCWCAASGTSTCSSGCSAASNQSSSGRTYLSYPRLTSSSGRKSCFGWSLSCGRWIKIGPDCFGRNRQCPDVWNWVTKRKTRNKGKLLISLWWRSWSTNPQLLPAFCCRSSTCTPATSCLSSSLCCSTLNSSSRLCLLTSE